MSFSLPRWLRLVLFTLLLSVVIALSLYGLRQASKPVTLKLAMGALDADVVKLMSAIGGRLAATGSQVRITIVEKTTPIEAAEAFSAGEADLALIRGDAEEIAHARAVVQLINLAVTILVPPNSPVKSIGDFKGKTVGIVGLEVNQRVIATLVRNYGFAQGSVNFVNVPFTDLLGGGNNAKKYQAVIFVAPLADRYNAFVRGFFPPAGKVQPRVLEIDSAEAIALSTKYYETFDMPKGALRGAPPLPDDAVATLRTPAFLVAQEKLSADNVAALAKGIMDIRRELLNDNPILAQIAAPDDDKNAAIPIHPGAKSFFDGEEKTFFDKYGDWMFYGPLLLGALGSLMAGSWKFLTGDSGKSSLLLIRHLNLLIERIRNAKDQSEIDAIERETDDVISEYLKAHSQGQIESDKADTINLMIGHMQTSIDRHSRAIRERRIGGVAPG